MKSHHRMLLVVLAGLLHSPSAWPETESSYQDLEQLRQQALVFLQHLPGIVSTSRISVGSIDTRLKLTACPKVEFSLPNNSQQRDNIRLSLRCSAPNSWSLFVSASILESKTYFITRTGLDKDHVIQNQDVIATEVFQTHTPPGAISDSQKFLGRSLTHPLFAGVAVRMTDLHPEPSLTRGQTVKIIGIGSGFQITRTGQLLANANPGQKTQVRTASKQIITGIARSGGIVEVSLHGSM